MIVKRIIMYRNETGLRVLKNKYILMIDRKMKFKKMNANVVFYSKRGRCGVNLSENIYLKYGMSKKKPAGFEVFKPSVNMSK